MESLFGDHDTTEKIKNDQKKGSKELLRRSRSRNWPILKSRIKICLRNFSNHEIHKTQKHPDES